MKKIFLLMTIGTLVLTGCTSIDFEDQGVVKHATEKEIRDNVESVFGTTFSPNQDWSSTTNHKVSITANADLKDIVKVQILSESPFNNPNSHVLNEIEAQKGQTVDLYYDCPAEYTKLIVACVSSTGSYYIKGFNVGDAQVSFTSSSNTRALTRGIDGLPALTNIKLELDSSFISYNAIRSIRSAEGENANNIGLWKNKGWENERLWKMSNNQAGNTSSWEIWRQSVRREVGGFSPGEKESLEALFAKDFRRKVDPENEKSARSDNMNTVRSNPMFTLHHNQLTSNGMAPITITPIQMPSSEIGDCELYYYYYNPSDTLGMSENQVAQYLKNLPKYMAFNCFRARDDAGISKSSEEFFKKYEYVLPYFGDHLDIQPTTLAGFETDGNVYLIQNQEDKVKYEDRKDKNAIKETHFLTYIHKSGTRGSRRMDVRYDESDAKSLYQLWQLFTNQDGDCYLYNIGSRSFLVYTPSLAWEAIFTSSEYLESNHKPFKKVKVGDAYQFLKGNTALATQEINKNTKDSLDYNVVTDKKTNDTHANWYLIPYNGKWKADAKKTIERVPTNILTAKDYIIPKDYKVGFMLMKGKFNNKDYYKGYVDKTYDKNTFGECYGDGRLNLETNKFDNHFSGSVSKYSMHEDDPRIAMFTANNKVYLTFEDGADCQFNDMVVEVGSEAIKEVDGIPSISILGSHVYTFCFEDRELGDYDLNDVVIKAQRIALDKVKYTLVACGAKDNLYLRNINGSTLNGNTEIHSLFGAKAGEFVNTRESDPQYQFVEEIVDVEPSFTFTDPEQQVYIYNASEGYEVKLTDNHVRNGVNEPHAIMIPSDYVYPLEKTCIKDAHLLFIDWGKEPENEVYKTWYIKTEDGKGYQYSLILAE